MRKKTITSPSQTLQLSLFDVLNNIHYDNNIQQNTGFDGQNIPTKPERADSIATATRQLQSQSIVLDDPGNTARTIKRGDSRQDTNSLPKRSGSEVLPANEGAYQQGTSRTGSGRDRMAVTHTNSRIVNYHSTEPPKNFTSFNKRLNFQDNINALNVLILLEKEHRPARVEEQSVLAKYVGFGGLKEILLNPSRSEEWTTASDKEFLPYVSEIYNCLDQLDPDGSKGLLPAAKRSILNAHYTSYGIINAMYQAIEKAGFKGGAILEPSAGIGNYLAAMPLEMAEKSEVTAIEMDGVSGKILQYLFPTAQTHITGFEKINLPENHYDLVISNVPFGQVKLLDTQLFRHRDKRFHHAASNIHNYFFAKSILLAKPGAMIALITSRYTMDSTQNQDIRELINSTSEFLGAIRLPDNAFKANAGTEVVTDMIFLRKFELSEEKNQKQDFLHTRTVAFTDEKAQSGFLTYNEYFHNNPSHMLGKVAFGGLYRGQEFNLKGSDGMQLYDAITTITDNIFVRPVLKQSHLLNTEKLSEVTANYISLSNFDTIGNIVTLENGFTGRISAEVYINETLDAKALELGIHPNNIRNGNINDAQRDLLNSIHLCEQDFTYKVVEEIKVTKPDRPKLAPIEALRKLTKQVVYAETGNFNEHVIAKAREKLRQAYFDFTAKFGNLLDRANDKVLKMDVDCFLVQSLEKQDKISGKISPSDILFERTIHPVREITSTGNIQDAIMVSLQKFGKLDMNCICELMDKPYVEIMQLQRGDNTFIFLDENNNHLTRSEYLSGNVVAKLEKARLLADNDPGFQNNVDQLEKVQPAAIAAVDIYSPLHARWIPQEYIRSFLEDALQSNNFKLNYSKSQDQYFMSIISSNAHCESFATKRKSANWLMNHALNGIEPMVTFVEKDANGNEKVILDAQDTHFAKDLYRKVKSAWDDWKFKDIDRREKLATIYNQQFNNTVLRKYDGQHQQFPGLLGYTLREHQKDAVFRNVQSLGGINDHMVGGGKTLIQICTAMELRRLAIANKPMIIGFKSQIPQLYEQFKKAYPLSKVLFPTEKDFAKDKRQLLLHNIATNDWDCIILSHDQFNAIRQPIEIQAAMIHELTSDIKTEIAQSNNKQESKRLEARLYKYEQKLDQLQEYRKDSNVLDFAQLGIDFLMVDESQEFKNLEFTTMKRNVRGLGNPNGSKRSFNMLVACRYLQDIHKGDKGILFSSGTPISNSMAELYLLFKYLRPEKMKETGLTSFDRWAANFANDYSDLEYYMGKFKEVHRFREFANLPELVTMYREIADVRNNHNLILEKPKAEHTLIKIKPSETQLALIEKLQAFIESKGIEHAQELGLTAGYDSRRDINPSFAILAINFAKKLSLDPRLIDPSFAAGTKLEEAAIRIAEIYNSTAHFKGTQLVFCDLGTPKSKNIVDNLYSFLETNTSQSELHEIFGENYHDSQKKPSLDMVSERIGTILNMTVGEIDNLIVEASTAEKFDVYSELKRLLIQKGIPENQTVFIHDYNSRIQKEKLFQAVNDGAIRIVLGSTKKLGTGVNIQQKAVAGHQLDILWNPAALEQRIGRFERQGNEAAKLHMGNMVTSYYYATERTLDASMYYVVAQKARFIAQLKTSDNPEVRTVKDIEEDVDMGSMAAELSGDPVFKEKATLQKRLTELGQLEKSFKQKKFDIEDHLRRSTILVAHYQQRIIRLEKAIPLLEKIPRDKDGLFIFSAEVAGSSYLKVGEFGTAVITEAEHARKYKPVGSQLQIASLWGFKVIGEVQLVLGDKEIIRQVISPLGDKIGQEKPIPRGEMAAGLQLKQAILDMPDDLIRMKERLASTSSNIEQYTKQLLDVFPYQTELVTKSTRLEEVNNIIINKLKQEQKTKTEPMWINLKKTHQLKR